MKMGIAAMITALLSGHEGIDLKAMITAGHLVMRALP
jgi:hypothetical protein